MNTEGRLNLHCAPFPIAFSFLLLACGAPEPAATLQEKRILQQIRQAPDARVLLCDSAGPSCDARRSALLKICLPDPDCQLYTVQKSQWPWLWKQLLLDAAVETGQNGVNR